MDNCCEQAITQSIRKDGCDRGHVRGGRAGCLVIWRCYASYSATFSRRESQLRRDLPRHAAALVTGRASATGRSRAIEIAAGVEYYIADRISSVHTAGKIMQRSVDPATAGGSQLED